VAQKKKMLSKNLSRRNLLQRSAALGVAAALPLSFASCLEKPHSAHSEATEPRGANPLKPPANGDVKVACLFSSNVTLIDWVGPEAVFDAWVYDQSTKQDRPVFEVFTVGESREIKDPGFNVIPDYTYEDAPHAQVIVVPAQSGSPQFYKWLKKASESADLTISVCTGARHLATLGLLDDQIATTHHDFIKPYSQEFPKVHWVAERRFVEGPKIATSAGVTAGIDLALRVVERYFGRQKALAVTKAIEYQGTAWMV
jgi:transcriptional regulator GlxA family with amidase domain